MFSAEEKEIENEGDIWLVKAKSSFHPPRNRNACLDTTIDFLQQQTFKTSCHNKSNLIKAEWKDLLALKNNSELIDANTYQKTDEECDNGVMKKIGELANKY